MTSSEAAKDLSQPAEDAAPEAADEQMPAIAAVAAVAAPVELAGVDAWQVIQVRPRLDSETHADLMTLIHEALAEGCRRIALDLTQNQFFSLNAIQLCMGLARDLANDEGTLALIGCNERTKKHFDIYGSLKQIRVVRTLAELISDRSAVAVMRPRSSQETR